MTANGFDGDQNGRLGRVAFVFYQALEVQERVGELGVQTPARGYAIDQCWEDPAVGRIIEAHDELRTGRLAFDPYIDAASHGVRANQRDDISVDEPVDLIQFFFGARDAGANRYLASRSERLRRLDSTDAAQKRKPYRPLLNCAQQLEGRLPRYV